MKRIVLVNGMIIVPAFSDEKIHCRRVEKYGIEWLSIESHCEIVGRGFIKPNEIIIPLNSIAMIFE